MRMTAVAALELPNPWLNSFTSTTVVRERSHIMSAVEGGGGPKI